MRILQPLFALFAKSGDSKLAQMVEYLKAENQILRSKLPTTITVSTRERSRLLKLGAALGSAINSLISIVSSRTFARWKAADAGESAAKKQTTRKPGRPRTAEDIRKLVLRLAREYGWGYTRILGELKKLGIRTVCRSTVINILKEAGLDPGPKRGKGTRDEFVKRHAYTLWACDFLSVKSITLKGFVDLYLLFFIHVGTRRVIVSGVSAHPDAAWVTQQARNASMEMDELGLTATHLLIDHDTKFAAGFDHVFEGQNTKVKRVGPLAPNMNAYAERWVQTLRTECLDHFLILGEKHLRYLAKVFVEHYNVERPHQGRGNVPLPDAQANDTGAPRVLKFPTGEVQCKERLGGLLKHYHRAAA